MDRQPQHDRRDPKRADRRKDWSRGGRRATDNREPRWFAPPKPIKRVEE
jgi:hypothetical protein